MKRRLLLALLAVVSVAWATGARAEDGYDLWLRYRPLPADVQARDRAQTTALVFDAGNEPSILKAAQELDRALSGMLGTKVPTGEPQTGAILLGTATQPRIQALNLPLGKLGSEGYLIRSTTIDGKKVTVVGRPSTSTLRIT